MSWLNQSQLQKALAGYTILTFSLVITATLYNLGTRNVPMVFEGSQGMEELVEKDRSDSSNNLSMPDSEMERFYNKSTNSLPSKTLPHLVVKYTGRSGEGSKLTTAIQQPSNSKYIYE